MGRAADVRAVFAVSGFRRLYAVRLAGQTADGMLQVGLTSYVFFSPERAASPGRIAAGFAVLLLPFSVVGPFAGVLLDRWRRRSVLVGANLARTAGIVGLAAFVAAGDESAAFFVLALVVLGVNRFILAALAAALPHVVAERDLVTGNAISPTSGTLAALLGAVLGLTLRQLLGGGDLASATVVATAAAVCAGAAALATRMAPGLLGPTTPREVPLRTAVGEVARGFAAGLQHLRRRPRAAAALAVMAGHRFLYGLATVMAILLFRNTLYPGDPDAALAGLGAAVALAGVGVLLGALVTPLATRRIEPVWWTSALLAAAAVTELVFGLPFRELPLLIGSMLLGAVSQGVKITVDTTVQERVDDDYRGRVFSLYDLLFNVAYVLAALVAAVALPMSGEAPVAVVVVACGYLALGAWYARVGRSVLRRLSR